MGVPDALSLIQKGIKVLQILEFKGIMITCKRVKISNLTDFVIQYLN